MHHEALYTPRQAAEFLKLSLSTLANHRCQGTGPAFMKAGKNVRYRQSDIMDWMKVRTSTTTNEDKAAG